MGGTVSSMEPNTRCKPLNKKLVTEYVNTSNFEEAEVDALWGHFNAIADEASEKISRKNFQDAIGSSGSLFLERMFQLFDENEDGFISFDEYISGLSVLSTRATVEEKIEFSFQIYDLDGDAKISRSELKDMLKASLVENNVKLTDSQAEDVVAATFATADLNGDGYIDIDEYRIMAKAQPSVLHNMTLDLARLLSKPESHAPPRVTVSKSEDK